MEDASGNEIARIKGNIVEHDYMIESPSKMSIAQQEVHPLVDCLIVPVLLLDDERSLNRHRIGRLIGDGHA
jgi:hypothetical protein